MYDIHNNISNGHMIVAIYNSNHWIDDGLKIKVVDTLYWMIVVK